MPADATSDGGPVRVMRGTNPAFVVTSEVMLERWTSDASLRRQFPDFGDARRDLASEDVRRLIGRVQFFSPLPSGVLPHLALGPLRQLAERHGVAEILPAVLDESWWINYPIFETPDELSRLLKEAECVLMLVPGGIRAVTVENSYWSALLGGVEH